MSCGPYNCGAIMRMQGQPRRMRSHVNRLQWCSIWLDRRNFSHGDAITMVLGHAIPSSSVGLCLLIQQCFKRYAIAYIQLLGPLLKGGQCKNQQISIAITIFGLPISLWDFRIYFTCSHWGYGWRMKEHARWKSHMNLAKQCKFWVKTKREGG